MNGKTILSCTKLGGVSAKPSIFFLFLTFCCHPGLSGLSMTAPDFFEIRIFFPSAKYPNLVLVAFLKYIKLMIDSLYIDKP